MKRSLLQICLSLLALLVLSQCAISSPQSLEAKMADQDKKMRERVRKSRDRSRAWDDRWKNYSSRQDANYNAWVKGAMR